LIQQCHDCPGKAYEYGLVIIDAAGIIDAACWVIIESDRLPNAIFMGAKNSL
jgi:hypothetical protein